MKIVRSADALSSQQYVSDGSQMIDSSGIRKHDECLVRRLTIHAEPAEESKENGQAQVVVKAEKVDGLRRWPRRGRFRHQSGNPVSRIGTSPSYTHLGEAGCEAVGDDQCPDVERAAGSVGTCQVVFFEHRHR